MKKITTVLIANRSEIARRVIRSAHECGIRTAAIHSPFDSGALFVRESDTAVQLTGNAPKESYLDIDQVLTAAKNVNADAVHPGYGFLSENADFSEAAARADIIFIGPTPEAISLLGNKTNARTLARSLGIPTPDGTTNAVSTAEEAAAIAREVGYPVLIKAAAGGGGKGMRIVENESEISESFLRAGSEALNAFGDNSVYIEKYIRRARHIEFQMLADSHGNVVHLGERECSIQRRYQKLIEESPSAVLDETTRRQMGEAASVLLRNAKYFGAGTVEFLLDEDNRFYFLEVNTRLQVEHPVTECVTGYDLVREQFRIAEGHPLSMKQTDVSIRGHSIEARIQAEDVWNNFLPSLGTIDYVRHPGGAFVRNDSALYNGLEVSGYYDSLLAKLIVWDRDRESAIARMLRALSEYRIAGVATTIPFAHFVMTNAEFRAGSISTKFVDEEFTDDVRTALYQHHLERLLPALTVVAKELQKKRERKLFVGV
jgi:propionyl-CoA carboxylase alpha chain